MSGTRSFRWTTALLGFAALAGIGGTVWGRTRQVYRVPFEEASTAFLQWCTGEPDVDPVAGERYLAMFGDRYEWFDLGFGLTTSALAGLLLVAVLFMSRHDEPWLRTPSGRWQYMLTGWAVIAWTYFAATYSFTKDLERRQLPWCADSIIIPIFEVGVASIILLIVCSAIGLLLMWRFGSLPVSLGQWNRSRPRYSWVVTIIFSLVAILLAVSTVVQAESSMSIANPALLLAIYLVASTRAALLAPKAVGE
jgi:hypothetical protein